MKNFGAAPRQLFVLSLCLAGVLSIASPVFAVRLIPGSAPETRPLQPMPEGSMPNLKENVQSQNTPSEQDNSTPVLDQNGSTNSSDNGVQPDSKNRETEQTSAGPDSQDSWVLAIILVAALTGGSLVYFRFRRR